ncbi:MAG: hypothetical protein ACE369_19290 [Roseovarius sp.]
MRAARQRTAICKTALTILVALFVAARVVAQPLILAAPGPGLIALCSGGQIVYVSIETGLPADTGEDIGHAADPCPFFGVTSLSLAAEATAPSPFRAAHTPVATVAEDVATLAGPLRQNTARAPPLRA